MITASMTSCEIRKIRCKDEGIIYAFQIRKAEELKREMRRQNVKSMSKTYEFSSPNADYFIVISVKKGELFSSGVFVYLRETNEYMPLARIENSRDECIAMSAHFLNRFAERYLRRDIPIKKILPKCVMSFIGAVKIYEDEKSKRLVFAVPEGLVLSTYDAEKKILHFKTFVSMEMLKATQAKSYGKIRSILDNQYNRITRARVVGDNDKLEALYKLIYMEADSLDITEAQEIYASFFEKGGKHGDR